MAIYRDVPWRKTLLIVVLYIIPILGFALPHTIWVKFVLAFCLSLPGIIYIIKHKELFSISYLGDWQQSIRYELLWLAPVLILILFFGNQLRDLLLGGIQGYGTLRSAVSPIVFILLYGVISSPLQELIFRGLMMHHSQQISNKPIFAVVVTSIVFALSHLWYPNISIVYITFVLGLIWGYSRIKYNSLVGPAIGHAVIGIVGFLMNII